MKFNLFISPRYSSSAMVVYRIGQTLSNTLVNTGFAKSSSGIVVSTATTPSGIVSIGGP